MTRSNVLAWRWLLGTLTLLIGILFIDEAFVKRREAETVAGALGIALLAGGWLYIKHRAVAVFVAGASGLVLTLRPWLLPITIVDSYTKLPYDLSATAERNLYAVIPGLILCAVAGLLAWTSRPR